MSRKPKFRPKITRIKLNPEQAVLVCDCYNVGHKYIDCVKFISPGGSYCSFSPKQSNPVGGCGTEVPGATSS